MRTQMFLVIALACTMFMVGCGKSNDGGGGGGGGPGVTADLPPINTPLADDSVVHGQAIVTVSSTQETAMMKWFKNIFPMAYAASSGSATVTYVNAASTNFTIDVSGLAPTFTPTFTGNTLNLGQVTVSSLSDNNLKVCNPGGNTKCTQAIIRVYNTGSTAGFINQAELYGAPVYTGTLNPSTALGLTSAASVQVQLHAIPGTEHKLTLASAFPSATYSVTSDFSNAGAGSYSMVYVVEYALSP